MTIEWDKVISKPTKGYKVEGQKLLDFRTKLEAQERKISDLTKTSNDLKSKVDSLETQVSSLESQIKGKTENISSLDSEVGSLKNTISSKEADLDKLNTENSELKKEIADLKPKVSGLEEQVAANDSTIANSKKEIEDKSSQIENLQNNLKSKETAITEKDGKISDLNTKIEELKEQIPKKRVIEKPDEVVKGPGCPKCGWTTVEEYKFIDEKKTLTRKYCPNTFCNWSWTTEDDKIAITVSDAAIEEEEEVLRVYKVNKDQLEEVPKIDSSMVGIIGDPEQNTVWIWKGNESSRFEYAEATGLAATVKNAIIHKPNANVIRVSEGEEPDNFPKLE